MLAFPFQATCVVEREISPLKLGKEVEVIGMPSEDDCEREMFVTVRWNEDSLAFPQLTGGDVDESKRRPQPMPLETLKLLRVWYSSIR